MLAGEPGSSAPLNLAAEVHNADRLDADTPSGFSGRSADLLL
jgi:hypothetical protein